MKGQRCATPGGYQRKPALSVQNLSLVGEYIVFNKKKNPQEFIDRPQG